MNSDKYSRRGVSSQKTDVHQAVKNTAPGVFPGAFCKAVQDPADKNKAVLMHADGAGTKSSLAYLYWRETGDLSVFKGIAQDALVMNTDDLLCAGVTDDFFLSNTIGRNKNRIPGEVIKAVIDGVSSFTQMLESYGIRAVSTGGETADVGDLVRTLIVDSTVYARLSKKDFINAAGIKPGQVIVALASFGKTDYENIYNAGIGSNGLTSARHELLQKKYARRYPESFDPDLPDKLVYCGRYDLTDSLSDTGMDIGRALLSPTRTYLPVIKKMFSQYRSRIKAIIHCSGGGLTKSLKFASGIHFVKDNLFPFPPLFNLLSKTTSMQEMFSVFNCGQRMEIYTDEKTAAALIDIAADFKLQARICGYTEGAPSNKLTIKYKAKTYAYPDRTD